MMSFSPSVVKELRAEAARLKDNIADLTNKIRDLSDEREQLVNKHSAITKLTGAEEHVVTARQSSILPSSDSQSTSIANVPLRAAIRAVLAESKSALAPKEVTDALKKAGFSPGGKTDLNVRVSNELFRLRKKHEVTRSARGYRLNPQSQGGA